MIYYFIQVRMGSTRFQGKVMTPISNGMKMVDLLYKRIQHSKYFSPNNTFFLTTTSSSDEPLVDYFKKQNWNYFCGEENNVFLRFYNACKKLNPTFFLRICGDNPFIEPLFIDKMIDFVSQYPQYDYISYMTPDGKPVIKTHYGFFAELINTNTFLKLKVNVLNSLTLEHVTSIFYENPDKFRIKFFPIPKELVDDRIRLTIDTPEDLIIVKQIIMNLKSDFNIFDVYTFFKQRKEVFDLMEKQIKRNLK